MREPSPESTLKDTLSVLTSVEWMVLAIGVVLSSFLAIGTHDLALAHLGVPYPYDSAVPVWVKYLNQLVRFAAMVFFCRLAAPYLDKMRAPTAALFMGIVVLAVNETLRVFVINWAIYDGWHRYNGLFVLLDGAPNAVFSFYHGAITVLIARYCRGNTKTIALVIIVSLIGYFGLLPVVKAAVTNLQDVWHISAPEPIYSMPFNWHVYRYIYGCFIETGCAALLMAVLVWPRLGSTSVQRVGLFVFLMLLLRGRIIAEFVYSFWLAPPLPMAFASSGQFFAETAVLTFLCGLLWDWTYQRVNRRNNAGVLVSTR